MKIKDIVEKGDEVFVISMINDDGYDDSRYDWRTGIVEFVDAANQIHGTWGGLALIPESDIFLIKGKGMFAKGEYYALGRN